MVHACRIAAERVLSTVVRQRGSGPCQILSPRSAVNPMGRCLGAGGFMSWRIAAEGAATAESAANVMNGVRLSQQLSLESANSAFTATGELSDEAIAGSQEIIPAGQLGNPAIPDGFSKFSTDTFASPSGPFQVHFYMNPTTGEVFYGLDYKSVFVGP